MQVIDLDYFDVFKFVNFILKVFEVFIRVVSMMECVYGFDGVVFKKLIEESIEQLVFEIVFVEIEIRVDDGVQFQVRDEIM